MCELSPVSTLSLLDFWWDITTVVTSLLDSIALNELLITLRKADMRREFKQVFDKLRGKKDFELDTCGYNICIHSFGCWGDLGASLSLFKEMKQKEKSLSSGSLGVPITVSYTCFAWLAR